MKRYGIHKTQPFWQQLQELARVWQCKVSHAIRRAVLEAWLKHVKKEDK